MYREFGANGGPGDVTSTALGGLREENLAGVGKRACHARPALPLPAEDRSSAVTSPKKHHVLRIGIVEREAGAFGFCQRQGRSQLRSPGTRFRGRGWILHATGASPTSLDSPSPIRPLFAPHEWLKNFRRSRGRLGEPTLPFLPCVKLSSIPFRNPNPNRNPNRKYMVIKRLRLRS